MLKSTSVIGVIEFGATARGDTDEHSDKDIFAVVDDVDADLLDNFRVAIATEYDTLPNSVACYSVSSFDQMIFHGSLFTWHLRLEGKILRDPYGIFAEAFGNLAKYDSFQSDLAQFDEIYKDARAAYDASKILDTFERHVLFVVVRNVCMLLNARRGRPSFGRRVVIPQARKIHPELPLSAVTADWLAAGHLAYMRNIETEGNSDSAASPEAVFQEVAALLNFAQSALR
jgi:predicted nucleotidyltransferase